MNLPSGKVPTIHIIFRIENVRLHTTGPENQPECEQDRARLFLGVLFLSAHMELRDCRTVS